jgi:hypothetical protein
MKVVRLCGKIRMKKTATMWYDDTTTVMTFHGPDMPLTGVSFFQQAVLGKVKSTESARPTCERKEQENYWTRLWPQKDWIIDTIREETD